MEETESKRHDPPTFGAIILFIAAVVITIGLVVGGTWFAVYSSNRNSAQITANQQASDRRWCHILVLLTSNPPPKPGPHALPVQVRSYILYGEFMKLKREFGC